MLYLPFRRTHDIRLSEAIKRCIENNCNQAPSHFAADLENIDNQRVAAIQVVEPHINNVRKLQAYAAQLICLERKIPKDVCLISLNHKKRINRDELR